MKIGDKVRLSGLGKREYGSSLHNPHKGVGEVSNIGYFEDIKVTWHNGYSNVYNTLHLELIDASPKKHSHYYKDVSKLDTIDIYMVCKLFEVDDASGAVQHAVKKLLCSGKRGVKDRKKDLQEAVDTLQRKLDMEDNNES